MSATIRNTETGETGIDPSGFQVPPIMKDSIRPVCLRLTGQYL